MHKCSIIQSSRRCEEMHNCIVLVTHSKERAYNYVQCNKSFGVAGSLKTHMLAHSGVKNHTCSECGKSFGQSGNLRSHMITHTRDRECGDSFGLAEHLKRHNVIRRVHKQTLL